MHVRLSEPKLQQLHVTDFPANTQQRTEAHEEQDEDTSDTTFVRTTRKREPWVRACSVVPGRVVVELVQQSVSQHGSVLIDEDVFTAVDADQQADDVRRTALGAHFI